MPRHGADQVLTLYQIANDHVEQMLSSARRTSACKMLAWPRSFSRQPSSYGAVVLISHFERKIFHVGARHGLHCARISSRPTCDVLTPENLFVYVPVSPIKEIVPRGAFVSSNKDSNMETCHRCSEARVLGCSGALQSSGCLQVGKCVNVKSTRRPGRSWAQSCLWDYTWHGLWPPASSVELKLSPNAVKRGDNLFLTTSVWELGSVRSLQSTIETRLFPNLKLTLSRSA